MAVFAALAPDISGAQAPVVQREFTIGCADCGGALQFSRIDDLALSSRGEFMVVDGEAPFMRQFDDKGKLVWQGGPKGKGPGEYSSIGRVVFLTNGGITVLDAGGMRVTVLSASHALQSTTPVPAYATTSTANTDGTILLGAESPRGGFSLTKFRNGVLTKLTSPKSKTVPNDTIYKGASIALAPNGTIAIMPNDDRYEILRMDSAGVAQPPIGRSIERTRKSAAEVAREREMSRKISAKLGAATNQVFNPNPAANDLPLKAYANVDGLRYDANGRLWVHTLRGSETSTVFDVFAPTGTYLGAVTIPEVTKYFALGGSWLLTASENADGIPVVTKWSVR